MKWLEHKLPRIVRIAAVVFFVAIGAGLVISYKSQYGFLRRGKGGLVGRGVIKRLISVSENIRHLRTEGDKVLFLLTAARDEVYDDGHHELKDVSLRVYGPNGETRATIQAGQCDYYQGSGLVIFARDVTATVADGTALRTEELRYDQNTGIISTESAVTFERANVSGQSGGAEVQTARGQEHVILKNDVNITVHPKEGASDSLLREPVKARCDMASYRKADSVVHLVGSVLITHAGEEFRADQVDAFFDERNRLWKIEASGHASLQSRAESRVSEVRSQRMGFFFSQQQRLERAVATGDALAIIAEALERRELRTARIEVSFLPFGQKGTEIYPSQVRGDGGRVELKFSAPPTPTAAGRPVRSSILSSVIPSEKRLEANAVELFYREGGRNLERIRASGDVLLDVIPVMPLEHAERKTIRADTMTAEFYECDNLVKTFTADGHVRVEFAPMVPTRERERRTTTSQHLLAEIDRETQDVAEIVQQGDFRFTEGERNASSEEAVYSASQSTISLRGGEPAIWDPRGRTRATEMELNTQTEETIARGNVLTTYYNPGSTGGAAPFADAQAPVFIAAQRLEVKHRKGIAAYIGNARAWQANNYVTADRIELHQTERMMSASGSVRSFIYTVRGAEAREALPVFVSAGHMKYLDLDRTVIYEGNVVMKRGSQRLSAALITVVLKRDVAEIERAVAEKNVSIAEPMRRAFGDQAIYTAINEQVALSGRPARVEDDRRRITQSGPRLTFLMGSDKVFIQGEEGSRRVRTVRRIQ